MKNIKHNNIINVLGVYWAEACKAEFNLRQLHGEDVRGTGILELSTHTTYNW